MDTPRVEQRTKTLGLRGRLAKRFQSSADQSTMIGYGAATPYAFTTPAILVVVLILVFPSGYSIFGSLFRQRLLDPGRPFVGLGNYREVIADPRFWDAVTRSFVFLTGVLIIGTALAAVFAFALMRAVGGLRFLRTIALLPYLVSGIATAVLFRLLLNRDYGLANQVLGFFGIEKLSWLAEPNLAMLSVILAQLWGDLPICILIILGGLQNIDPEYLDAAHVDGASGWKRVTRIYLPLARPQLLLSTVFLSYGGIGAFATILALTGGGPGDSTGVVGVFMYRTAFERLDMGQGLAIVVALFLVNSLFVAFLAWVGRSREEV